jgi:hypothetical protein
MSRIATSWRWCERRPASGVEIEMNRTLNAKVTGPFAPPRPPTVEEELAARERTLKQLYPRPGPPPKPYIHVPPGRIVIRVRSRSRRLPRRWRRWIDASKGVEL